MVFGIVFSCSLRSRFFRRDVIGDHTVSERSLRNGGSLCQQAFVVFSRGCNDQTSDSGVSRFASRAITHVPSSVLRRIVSVYPERTTGLLPLDVMTTRSR